MITGTGDHLRPEWPITITGMRKPDGAKLQFTRDGQFLVAQRVQFPSQVFIRIWDLRPSWLAWIEDPNTTEKALRAAACRIVRMEAGDGAFDEIASKLFQIDAARREPCPGTEEIGRAHV